MAMNNPTHGWTNQRVALDLGATALSVGRYLNGDRYPDIRMMHKIHSVFNWPPRDQVDLVPAHGHNTSWAMVFRDVLNNHYGGSEIVGKDARGRNAVPKTVVILDGLSGLPVGTRIATAQDKIMYWEEKEDGVRYWIEAGALEPFPRALTEWLPAYILPV